MQHIYYAGGKDGGNNPSDSAAVYDPASDSHTDLPSMSRPREYLGMGRLGGLVCDGAGVWRTCRSATGGSNSGSCLYASTRTFRYGKP